MGKQAIWASHREPARTGAGSQWVTGGRSRNVIIQNLWARVGGQGWRDEQEALFKARSEVFPLRTRDDALVLMPSIPACEVCEVRVCQASWKLGSEEAKRGSGDVKTTIGT